MRKVQEALGDLGVPVFAGIWRPTAGYQNPPGQYMVYSSTTTEDAHQDDTVVSYKARKRKGIEMKMLALPERVLPLGTYVVLKPIEAAQAEGARQKITPVERGNRAKG